MPSSEEKNGNFGAILTEPGCVLTPKHNLGDLPGQLWVTLPQPRHLRSSLLHPDPAKPSGGAAGPRFGCAGGARAPTQWLPPAPRCLRAPQEQQHLEPCTQWGLVPGFEQ